MGSRTPLNLNENQPGLYHRLHNAPILSVIADLPTGSCSFGASGHVHLEGRRCDDVNSIRLYNTLGLTH